jgi:hypothetical protein
VKGRATELRSPLRKQQCPSLNSEFGETAVPRPALRNNLYTQTRARAARSKGVRRRLGVRLLQPPGACLLAARGQ